MSIELLCIALGAAISWRYNATIDHRSLAENLFSSRRSNDIGAMYRYWPLADIRSSIAMSAFRAKATEVVRKD